MLGPRTEMASHHLASAGDDHLLRGGPDLDHPADHLGVDRVVAGPEAHPVVPGHTGRPSILGRMPGIATTVLVGQFGTTGTVTRPI